VTVEFVDLTIAGYLEFRTINDARAESMDKLHNWFGDPSELKSAKACTNLDMGG